MGTLEGDSVMTWRWKSYLSELGGENALNSLVFEVHGDCGRRYLERSSLEEAVPICRFVGVLDSRCLRALEAIDILEHLAVVCLGFLLSV